MRRARARQGDPVEPAEPKRAEKTDDEALLRAPAYFEGTTGVSLQVFRALGFSV